MSRGLSQEVLEKPWTKEVVIGQAIRVLLLPRRREQIGAKKDNLSSLKEPCAQVSRCGTCRGCSFCEEMEILLPELIFTFLCELRTSPRVPSNLDNGDAALLQLLDFTINDLH
ncbi:hypothetical protein Tco_0169671 [Tanacetum coccineum]